MADAPQPPPHQTANAAAIPSPGTPVFGELSRGAEGQGGGLDSSAAARIECIACGYDVRAVTAEICPECGVPLDRQMMRNTRLAWRRRAHRGVLRTYFATVFRVIAHPGSIGAEVQYPIAFGDGRAFWRITLLLAYVPIMALAGLLLWHYLPDDQVWRTLRENPFGLDWAIGCELLGLLLLLIAVTGVPSYCCHPRRIPVQRQNRAIVLSYFASAPLALAAIPIALDCCASPLFNGTISGDFTADAITAALLAPLLIWAVRNIRFYRPANSPPPHFGALRLSILFGVALGAPVFSNLNFRDIDVNLSAWPLLLPPAILLYLWINSTLRIILRATGRTGPLAALRIGLLLGSIWITLMVLLAGVFPYLLYAMIMIVIHMPR